MLPVRRSTPFLRPLILGLTALAPCVSAPAMAADWSPTATLAVPVTSLLNAADLGKLPATQALTIRVGMKLRDQAGLLARVQKQSVPGSVGFLTPQQVATAYGPTTAQIQHITTYLQNHGFTNITVEPNGLLISADGTATQAEAAFHTTLEKISVGGVAGFVNITGALIPTEIAPTVASILGLNTIGQMRSTLALPLPTYIASYTPKQFQTIYSAADSKTANFAAIAIMAEGDVRGVITDLRTAEAAFGLQKVAVQVEQVGLASTDVSGIDEWDMDTQYSTGMAGYVRKLYIYATTSLSDSDLALEFSRWQTDDLAKAASASLGECEIFPYVDGSMTIDDEIFLAAAAQGQTFFASAGDTGSFCPVGPAGVNGVPLGAPLVNYPAASPYVVGVGGTSLLTNSDGSYNSEITWVTGGGGLSQFEGSPYWQASAVSLLGTANLRGVPDIAMDADPNSGATVYVNGAPEAVGGTSLSSPLALGVWARAFSNDAKLGAAGPVLYSLYDGATTPATYPKGGFHDISVGANGLYTALPGDDLTTGLGTFIVDQTVTDLAK